MERLNTRTRYAAPLPRRIGSGRAWAVGVL